MSSRLASFALASLLILPVVSFAQTAPLTPAGPASVSVDENGAGFWFPPAGGLINLPFNLGADPGPGGLPQVLIYHLPPGTQTIQGDVRLHDPLEAGNPFLDVIRFNGDGTLIFYSDNIDGFDALGDTPSPPSAFYAANLVDGTEFGPEGGLQGADYVPAPGQPGFDPTGQIQIYHLISDVPEPASISLAGLGAMLLIGRRRR
jgi:hypothetical protein